MKRERRADRFITIYNCSADSRPAPEVIAIDSIRHVWMALPNETEVVIEYYRQSTDSIASMKEYYNCKSNAKARMARILRILGCDDWEQSETTGIMLEWQYEANN